MLNTAPNAVNIHRLVEEIRNPSEQCQYPDGSWGPARAYGFYSLSSRLKLAWHVFTGKADALYWPSQMPKAY